MKKPRILVVGSINMDLVLPLEKAPEAGETVFGSGYSYVAGGKGANQAVAAARLGCDVTFAGRVGDDDNGAALLKNLQNEGVDISCVKADPSSQTGLAVIPVEASGQNRIIVIPGANMRVEVSDVERALAGDFDAVMLQLEIPLETVYETHRLARAKGIPVILDAGPAMPLPLNRLYGIDVISPNETEIYALTGIRIDSGQRAVEAARRLSDESGAGCVVVKMGKRGALLYKEGSHEFFDTFLDVKPVDSTAAGDSFTAGLTAQLCIHGDIRRAIRYANAVGSICVSRKGAQPSLPTASEVSRFLSARGLE